MWRSCSVSLSLCDVEIDASRVYAPLNSHRAGPRSPFLYVLIEVLVIQDAAIRIATLGTLGICEGQRSRDDG
jgi:hypothetical protein